MNAKAIQPAPEVTSLRGVITPASFLGKYTLVGVLPEVPVPPRRDTTDSRSLGKDQHAPVRTLAAIAVGAEVSRKPELLCVESEFASGNSRPHWQTPLVRPSAYGM